MVFGGIVISSRRFLAVIRVALVCSAMPVLVSCLGPPGQPSEQSGGLAGGANCQGTSVERIWIRTASSDQLCVPLVFARNGEASFLTSNQIYLEASFPGMKPHIEQVAPGRFVRVRDLIDPHSLSLAINFGVPKGERSLNRLVREEGWIDSINGPTAPQAAFDFPDDQLHKRIHREGDIQGLGSYLVDQSRVQRYLVSIGASPDDGAVLSNYRDWHIRRAADGEILTLIRCDVAVAAIRGENSYRRPLCEHLFFYGSRRDVTITVRYFADMLLKWQQIENETQQLLRGFVN